MTFNSVSEARAIGRGTGVAWLLVIPAEFLTLYVYNSADTGWISGHGSTAALIDGAMTVAILALWYFVIARLAVRRTVAGIRSQTLGDGVVRGVRMRASGKYWIAETLRGSSVSLSRGRGRTSLVATSQELQVWVGSGDDAAPVGTIPWNRVARIAQPGPGVMGAEVVLHLVDPIDLIGFDSFNPRLVGWTFDRGRRRDDLVKELETVGSLERHATA